MARSCPPARPAPARRAAGGLFSLILLIATTLPSVPAWPQAASDQASAHVLALVEEFRAIIDDADPFRTRVARVSALVDMTVARSAVARYVAGPSWNVADVDHREAYLIAYGRYLDVLIARRLETYAGEQVVHLGARLLEDGDSLVALRVDHDRAATRIVQWRIRMSDTGPLILDVLVDGVSLAANQREEFAAIHDGSSEGIALLTAALEAQTERMIAVQ